MRASRFALGEGLVRQCSGEAMRASHWGREDLCILDCYFWSGEGF